MFSSLHVSLNQEPRDQATNDGSSITQGIRLPNIHIPSSSSLKRVYLFAFRSIHGVAIRGDFLLPLLAHLVILHKFSLEVIDTWPISKPKFKVQYKFQFFFLLIWKNTRVTVKVIVKDQNRV